MSELEVTGEHVYKNVYLGVITSLVCSSVSDPDTSRLSRVLREISAQTNSPSQIGASYHLADRTALITLLYQAGCDVADYDFLEWGYRALDHRLQSPHGIFELDLALLPLVGVENAGRIADAVMADLGLTVEDIKPRKAKEREVTRPLLHVWDSFADC